MSKKKKDTELGGHDPEVAEPVGREDAVTQLVAYIRTVRKTTGTVNTAHGPLYVLDPERIDKLVEEIDPVEEDKPDEVVVPVGGESHVQSEASLPPPQEGWPEPPKEEHHW